MGSYHLFHGIFKGKRYSRLRSSPVCVDSKTHLPQALSKCSRQIREVISGNELSDPNIFWLEARVVVFMAPLSYKPHSDLAKILKEFSYKPVAGFIIVNVNLSLFQA